MSFTVLIVDDHQGFRASARTMLQSEGFTVVGEAADGAAALVEVARMRPRIVLLDIQLPDFDGFEVAERILAGPDPPVVVLISGRNPDDFGARIAASAATGFIAKSDLTGNTLMELVG